MQLEEYFADDKYYDCQIPDADDEVLAGVKWGNVSQILTPAFWRFHCLTNRSIEEPDRYHLGSSLREEVVACLLGGHGIVGETGIAAYKHLRRSGIIEQPKPHADDIEQLLRQPLHIGSRTIKYRYPKQKAKYIAAAIGFLNENTLPEQSGSLLRDSLTEIPGIGLKTAAWITRNWLDSNDVAILDIHIHRAGVIAGFYSPNDDVVRSYRKMEKTFLAFADAIEIPAGVLDNQIWNQMRMVPSHVRSFLINQGAQPTDKCGLPSANYRRAPGNYDLFTHA